MTPTHSENQVQAGTGEDRRLWRKQQVIEEFGLELIHVPILNGCPVPCYFLFERDLEVAGPYLDFFDAFIAAIAHYRTTLVS